MKEASYTLTYHQCQVGGDGEVRDLSQTFLADDGTALMRAKSILANPPDGYHYVLKTLARQSEADAHHSAQVGGKDED